MPLCSLLNLTFHLLMNFVKRVKRIKSDGCKQVITKLGVEWDQVGSRLASVWELVGSSWQQVGSRLGAGWDQSVCTLGAGLELF